MPVTVASKVTAASRPPASGREGSLCKSLTRARLHQHQMIDEPLDFGHVIGANEVVRVTTGQEEVDGVAECIDQGMDLLGPPRDRPIAWSPSFFRAGTVLVGAHNGAVDHRVFIVGTVGEMLSQR
jgi:hypothetical protein